LAQTKGRHGERGDCPAVLRLACYPRCAACGECRPAGTSAPAATQEHQKRSCWLPDARTVRRIPPLPGHQLQVSPSRSTTLTRTNTS